MSRHGVHFVLFFGSIILSDKPCSCELFVYVTFGCINNFLTLSFLSLAVYVKKKIPYLMSLCFPVSQHNTPKGHNSVYTVL